VRLAIEIINEDARSAEGIFKEKQNRLNKCSPSPEIKKIAVGNDLKGSTQVVQEGVLYFLYKEK